MNLRRCGLFLVVRWHRYPTYIVLLTLLAYPIGALGAEPGPAATTQTNTSDNVAIDRLTPVLPSNGRC